MSMLQIIWLYLDERKFVQFLLKSENLIPHISLDDEEDIDSMKFYYRHPSIYKNDELIRKMK